MRMEADRDSAPWWDGVDRGEVLLQQCADCGVKRFPARAVCNRCQGRKSVWVPAEGTGRIYSWIVNHQKFMPDVPVPYAVLCVRLDEGEHILMYGNLVEGDPTQITQGMRVEAVIVEGLVQWRPLSR
ncbi:Zn-ribbon domain-containing OB-fold protein [Actinocorallia longicatena]|uniref:OB-fold domain-containing protein n=1 Tax=Actinocorallia longicatena TaxID=111803 RepID=A0ABP6Q0N6_9ACTN